MYVSADDRNDTDLLLDRRVPEIGKKEVVKEGAGGAYIAAPSRSIYFIFVRLVSMRFFYLRVFFVGSFFESTSSFGWLMASPFFVSFRAGSCFSAFVGSRSRPRVRVSVRTHVLVGFFETVQMSA